MIILNLVSIKVVLEMWNKWSKIRLFNTNVNIYTKQITYNSAYKLKKINSMNFPVYSLIYHACSIHTWLWILVVGIGSDTSFSVNVFC